jgi:hypothetical protein
VTDEEVKRRLLADPAVEAVECTPVSYTAVTYRLRLGATKEDRFRVYGIERDIHEESFNSAKFDFHGVDSPNW